MIRASVVGVGHLGRHHARILNQLENVEMIGAFDADAERLAAVCEEHGVTALPSFEAAAQADAVVLATPTVSHCELGLALFSSGCHVMVEKPIAASVAEANEMVAAADGAGKVLAVGHVEFHNPAVQKALSMLRERGDKVRYLETQRLSPFTARSMDIDVILDLMVHDLQIALAVAGEEPSEIRAVGVPVLTDKVDLCHTWMEFPSGLVANLTASRVSSERIRKLRLFAGSSYGSIDYAEQSLTSARLVPTDDLPKIEAGPVEVVKAEPLRAELEEFLAACQGQESTSVDGRSGTAALAAAIAVREAVEARG